MSDCGEGPGEMENLKEKIFQFGIYGAKLGMLDGSEVEMVIGEPWAEIITADAVEGLKRNFTTDCLRTETNRFMVENFSWSDLYVRMGSLAWKDYLTSGTFNFTSKEYFLIMSLLIEARRYVDNVELRKLNLDPKKTHYCINRLARKGFIEYKTSEEAQKKNFIYKVRAIVDERGFVMRRVAEKQLLDTNRADLPGKKRMFEYRIDIGLYDNIREMILNSKDGIITEDLKNKLGVSSKIGYKLLNKIFNEEKDAVTRTEEFKGRIRRYRYHVGTKSSEEAFQEGGDGTRTVGYITSEERVRAIRKLMSTSPILQLDKRTYEKLQELTGWRYEFDRRTIIKSAVLAGFKIYKQKRGKEGKCSRYMIMRNEMVESDIRALDVSNCDFQESMSEFQRKIYNIFVNSPKFVEMDNGYIPLREERLKLLYRFLVNHMTSRGDESLRFDWEVVREMEFNLLLSIVPFNRIGFRESLCRFIDSGGADGSAFKRRSHELSGEAGASCAAALSGKTVSDIVGLKLPQSIRKLIRLKVGVGNFVSLLKQMRDLQVLDMEISCERVVIKGMAMDPPLGLKALEKAKRAKGRVKYVCLSRRLEFFEKICNTEEKGFYDQAYKVIYTEFKGDELEAMFDRLKMFRDREADDSRQNSLERLYMGFKRNIIELGWIGTLDFNAYSVSEAKRALKTLSRDKVISNYKGIRRVEFVTPHESFLKVINRKYDVFRFKGYHEHKGMGYFSHYFDLVYYILATSGSLEISELMSRVRFMADFEMELFLSEYKSVFKVSMVNGTRIVSLSIFMDPFE